MLHQDLAKQQQVPLQDFRIIYQVFDYIRVKRSVCRSVTDITVRLLIVTSHVGLQDRLSEKMPLQRQDIVAGSAEILAVRESLSPPRSLSDH